MLQFYYSIKGKANNKVRLPRYYFCLSFGFRHPSLAWILQGRRTGWKLLQWIPTGRKNNWWKV